MDQDLMELEMNQVLDKLGYSDEVKEKFKKEKIYVSTVPVLTRDQFTELGIMTMGEIILLKEACKQSTNYTKVASEVTRIMAPALPCSSSSGKVTLQKRKGKKYSTTIKPKVQVFQKKLVVLKYMGRKSPLTFGRHESDILFRGLLPEIPLSSNETEIRRIIIDILHSNKSFLLESFDLYDFEFLEAYGKKLTVPTCGDNFEFNGKSVKQLAGVGAVYIRLTKKLPPRGPFVVSDESDDLEPLNKEARQDSDSSFELPDFSNISWMPSAQTMSISHDDVTSPETNSCSSTITPLIDTYTNSNDSTSLCTSSTQSILPNTTWSATSNSTVEATRPTGRPTHSVQATPTGRPTHSVQATPPTGRPTHSVQATPPTGRPTHSVQATPPTGRPTHSVQATPPTGRPTHSVQATPPTERPTHSVQATPATGRPTHSVQATPPTGRPTNSVQATATPATERLTHSVQATPATGRPTHSVQATPTGRPTNSVQATATPATGRPTHSVETTPPTERPPHSVQATPPTERPTYSVQATYVTGRPTHSVQATPPTERPTHTVQATPFTRRSFSLNSTVQATPTARSACTNTVQDTPIGRPTPFDHTVQADSVIATPPSPSNVTPPASPNLSVFYDSYIEEPYQYDAPPTTLEGIHEMYSSLSIDDISLIFEVSGRSYPKTLHFLENQSLNNLLDLLYSHYIGYCTEESPKLTIERDTSPEEMAEVLLSFYKSGRFSTNACVRVMDGTIVMDSGGVRRQLYSTAFSAIANGHMQIFDGPGNRIRPAIKPCNIASGILRNLGKAIAHYLIMDKCGFPFLSPPIYHYLVGENDIAVTLLEDIDVSGESLHVINKIKSCCSKDKLVDDEEDMQYIDNALNQCGSELTLNVANRDSIIQTLLMHYGLFRRKSYLDSIAEGLQVFKIFTFMKTFPGLFKPVFTSREICSTDVIQQIVPLDSPLDDHMFKLISSLFDYISELSEEGLKCFLRLVTGSDFLINDCIIVRFTSLDTDPPLSFHTCAKTIVISTKIVNTEELKAEFDVLIQDRSFTMA
ncbi:PREDICTED: uncharacterized protein LOC109585612 [Amphimedon queenslandica]|uniref:HECT domain-containing protein n=1 Tax=Amphimedon queenslandica TaxID=400682 RepID=A0AAN0JJV3_AMPQE|nr:PREDICTED: uncharacterized protein LOC109585612 [Amphimedon queenslandica]|eukprot:XP_019857300.1 PREDICTED: uncharacterized protein LOC109585612 [Amphimedon queenslandica]